MKSRTEIRKQLVEAGLERVADEIASLAQPAITLFSQVSSDEALPVGISKFGGHPDVPSDFMWPTWNDRPLAFLAQLKLAELTETSVAMPLPATGLLSFFCECEAGGWGLDPNDRGSWRVYYFEEGQTLTRVNRVPVSEKSSFLPCDLSFEEVMTLPSWQSLEIMALQLTDDETYNYLEICSDNRRATDHQILGHPVEVHHEMQMQCQFVSQGISAGLSVGDEDSRFAGLRPKALQWRLLFQIGTDVNPGWIWRDNGTPYLWINESDLTAHCFDHVWMVFQCE